MESDPGDDRCRPKSIPLGLRLTSVADGAGVDRSSAPLLRTGSECSPRPRDATGLVAVAEKFDAICSAVGVSNRAMARRLKVTEKILRLYRRGDRPIPSHIWERIGRSVAEPMLLWMLARTRGEVPTRA